MPGPGRKGATPPIHAITPPPTTCAGGVGYPPPLVGHSTRNAPFGTGRHGGQGPPLCKRGGVGVGSRKNKTGGRGVAEILEGTLPPSPFWGGVGGYWGDLFLESSVPASNFFWKSQLGARTFFEILSNRPALFLETSARDLNFFCKAQAP